MSNVIENFKEDVPPCVLDPSELEETVNTFDCDSLSDLNVARKDKFILIVDLPNSFLPIRKKIKDKCKRECSLLDINKLQLNIFANIVPEITIPKIEKPFGGQVMNFSSHARPTYSPIKVDFEVDAGYVNYYVLYKWLDIINDDLNSEFNYEREINDSKHSPGGRQPYYTSTMNMYALDEYNNKAAKWTFFGCFPTVLGGIDYSKRDAAIIVSSFTFEFSFLKMELGDFTKIL